MDLNQNPGSSFPSHLSSPTSNFGEIQIQIQTLWCESSLLLKQNEWGPFWPEELCFFHKLPLLYTNSSGSERLKNQQSVLVLLYGTAENTIPKRHNKHHYKRTQLLNTKETWCEEKTIWGGTGFSVYLKESWSCLSVFFFQHQIIHKHPEEWPLTALWGFPVL